jgi:hypothetical protein
MIPFLTISLIVFGVTGLILNGRIKSILDDKAYPVSNWHHLQDITNIFDLAYKTKNPSDKKRYYLLGRCLVFFYLGFIIFGILLIIYDNNL